MTGFYTLRRAYSLTAWQDVNPACCLKSLHAVCQMVLPAVDFHALHLLDSRGKSKNLPPDTVGPVTNAQDFDLDLGEALSGEAEFVCNGFGDIEHTAPNERTAIVDADGCGAAVFEVGHPNHARDGKRFVSGGPCPGPEFFTDGSLSGKY